MRLLRHAVLSALVLGGSVSGTVNAAAEQEAERVFRSREWTAFAIFVGDNYGQQAVATKLNAACAAAMAVDAPAGAAPESAELRCIRSALTAVDSGAVYYPRDQLDAMNLLPRAAAPPAVATNAALIAPGMAYVSLRSLTATTRAELLAVLSRLEQAPAGALKSVILDLRGNPGGDLAAVGEIADIFIPTKTPILKIKGNRPNERQTLLAQVRAAIDAPAAAVRLRTDPRALTLALIVDKQTASGAEALAQVLRSQRKAKIVGQRSAGNADLHAIAPLGDGAAIKRKMATIYAVNDFTWAGAGIKPDKELAQAAVQPQQLGKIDADSWLSAARAVIAR